MSKGQWTYRAHVFIPAGRAQQAADAWEADFPGGLAERRSFDIVRLSASGSAPATALGLSTAATGALLLKLRARLIDANLGTVRGFVLDADGRLLETNHAPSQASIGQPWTFAQSLSALSLARIIPPSSTPKNKEERP